MEVRAIAKYVRVQPRKVRIVAREVKGEPAVLSAHKLGFHPSKGAFALRKVLVSAISNAAANHGLAPETLKIKSIAIDEGPKLKRITQKAMGRGARTEKKMSHITVIVEDVEGLGARQKPHGTKAKARPKFDAPRRRRGGAAAAEAAAPAAEVVEEVKEEAIEETPAEVPAEEPQAEEPQAEEPKAEGEGK